MASVNKVFLIGRLGKDPEVRSTQGGASVCNMTLATDESYTDRDGNKHESVEWHKVTAFAKQADNCGQYLHKGSLIYVEGSLRTKKWQDQNGQDRYTTEVKADRIQFLDSKQNSGNAGQQPQRQQAPQQRGYDNGDSVPF